MSKLNDALVALKAAQDQLAKVTAQLQRFPQEPPIGTVLVWEKEYPTRYGASEQTFHYAALRAGNDLWYVTGRDSQSYSWEEIVEKIGDSTCRVTVSWKDVPKQDIA